MEDPSVKPPVNTGAIQKLLAALRAFARPVTNAQLQVATGLPSGSIPAMLRTNVRNGVVVRTGGPRSALYALKEFASEAPMPKAAPAAAPAPAPAPAEAMASGCKRGPRGRTVIEPWTPRTADRPPSAPALPAGMSDLPPGVKVLVHPTPRGRYEVDPATVPLLFSALRPGQYLEGA